MGAFIAFTKVVEVASIPIGKIVKKGSGSGVIIPATADTDDAFGNTVDSNFNAESKVDQEASIAYGGQRQVLFGENVSDGALLTSDGNGDAIALTGAGAKTVTIIGRAHGDAQSGQLGEIIGPVYRLHIPA